MATMEAPEGVARVRAQNSLRQVEDTAELLNRVAESCGERDSVAGSGGTDGAAGDGAGGRNAVAVTTPGAAAAAPPPVTLGVDVPRQLVEVMDSLSALASREDAERLLEAGTLRVRLVFSSYLLRLVAAGVSMAQCLHDAMIDCIVRLGDEL